MRGTVRRWLELFALAASVGSVPAHADDAAPPDSWWSPQSVWLNPGVYSEHFNQHLGYRQANWGFGAQINLPDDFALLGGEFLNSNDARSHDLGVLWQPWAIGPFKIGAVAGGFNGYPYMHNGGWFSAVLPMASITEGIVGANFSIVPNYANRLHGAFVVQLILKVW